MVKCKDGAYVCYELYLEVMENLRKSAEINPAQSPHDGIHTCSKGCKKPGCNRGLRETIEEQDAQIEALKQDLLEQTAAVRNSRMANIYDLNHVGGLQEDNARLKAEVERLRAASFVTAVPVEHYERVVKAGDAVALDYAERIEIEAGETAKTLMKTLPVLRDWTAAKEGKPSV